jgi:YD repeat-containing protein
MEWTHPETDNQEESTSTPEEIVAALSILESGYDRTYDSQGNLILEKNFFGEEWRYTYDSNNKLLTETSPEGVLFVYDPDHNERLLGFIDSSNEVTLT